MRALSTVVVLLLIALATPGIQATSMALPEEVCFQTQSSQLAQYHCAGLDDEEQVPARVIRAQTTYTMQAIQCVGIEGGSTVTVTVYVDACASYLTGLQPVSVTSETVTVRPIHLLASVGSIPAACEVLGKLCPVISTPAVCPAWGCGPVIAPCPVAWVDACATSSYAYAEIDNMGLADIDEDGTYDGVALQVGRGWIVLEAIECSPPSISIHQSQALCNL